VRIDILVGNTRRNHVDTVIQYRSTALDDDGRAAKKLNLHQSTLFAIVHQTSSCLVQRCAVMCSLTKPFAYRLCNARPKTPRRMAFPVILKHINHNQALLDIADVFDNVIVQASVDKLCAEHYLPVINRYQRYS